MKPIEYLHIVPMGDLRDHEDSCACWCRPTEEEDHPGIWMHHALDGREKYESGELKLQ